jgi:hypothetical protein
MRMHFKGSSIGPGSLACRKILNNIIFDWLRGIKRQSELTPEKATAMPHPITMPLNVHSMCLGYVRKLATGSVNVKNPTVGAVHPTAYFARITLDFICKNVPFRNDQWEGKALTSANIKTTTQVMLPTKHCVSTPMTLR